MVIASWNVNGLRSIRKKGFKNWLEKTAYDFYCLQETRVNEDQLSEELKNLYDFKLYLNPAERKGYSGTAVYTKKKPLKIITSMNFPKADHEGRFLQLDYVDFSLINIYVPNGGRKKEWLDYKFSFFEKLFQYLQRLSNKKVIITGDFNIAHKEVDLARPSDNKNSTMFTPKERQQIDHLLNLGYLDTFRETHLGGGHYSWWLNFHKARERNIGWRIDYLFISKNLGKKLSRAFILDKVMGSDHCPVGIEIDLAI